MSLAVKIQDFATRVASEIKSVRTLVNGNAADNSALLTTNKTNLVASINELHAAVESAATSGGASINDAAVGGTTTWSSQKIDSQIDTDVTAAINALVDGAPAALDTLKELADALAAADDSTEIAAIMTALENRVRFDAAQTLTEAQKTQARSNIGAGTSDLTIGTTSTTAKAGNYTPPNATTGAVGLVQLAGDLAGTATAPTVRAATTAVAGKVALATNAEAATGTDTTKAVTPSALKSVIDTKANTSHTHTASQISDSTTTGRSVITGDAAAGRTALDVYSKAEIGDPNTDFVATFVAGL